MKRLLLIIICLAIGFYFGTLYQGLKIVDDLVNILSHQQKIESTTSTDESLSERIKQTPNNLKKLFTEPEDREESERR